MQSFVIWMRRYRLGLAVVLASALLHGILLDLWRGAVGGPTEAPMNLHASLRAEARAPVVAPPQQSASGVSSPSIQRMGPRRDAPPVPASPAPATATPAPATAPVASGEAGLRPLTEREGQAAWRLALLHELGNPGPLASPLHAWVSLHPGQSPVVSLADSSGDPVQDQAWLAALTRSAARTAVPSVLAGQTVRIELEFQPE